jgi:hypothetical protein
MTYSPPYDANKPWSTPLTAAVLNANNYGKTPTMFYDAHAKHVALHARKHSSYSANTSKSNTPRTSWPPSYATA